MGATPPVFLKRQCLRVLTKAGASGIVKYMLKYQDDTSLVFQALSDPARRSIVERLGRGPASVGELARPLPISLPAVHQHLAVLESCGLVRSRKAGRVRTCELDVKKLAGPETWLRQRRADWEANFDRLDAYLASLPPEPRPATSTTPPTPAAPEAATAPSNAPARPTATVPASQPWPGGPDADVPAGAPAQGEASL